MANSETELVSEVRSFGQYKNVQLGNPEIEVAISRAKSHLLGETRLTDKDVDWYGIEAQEEALFWTTMLFTKVQTGALDAASITVGAIEEDSLLSHEDGEVTLWYKNYRSAKQDLVLESGGGNRTIRTGRTQNDGSRYYEKREEL